MQKQQESPFCSKMHFDTVKIFVQFDDTEKLLFNMSFPQVWKTSEKTAFCDRNE